MVTESPSSFHAGYVALIGRPNAGKSTLLNRLVGEKIAAVSNKPQTTRFKILGIVTKPEGQIVLVDTPGVHKPGYELNRRMMVAVHAPLVDSLRRGQDTVRGKSEGASCVRVIRLRGGGGRGRWRSSACS